MILYPMSLFKTQKNKNLKTTENKNPFAKIIFILLNPLY